MTITCSINKASYANRLAVIFSVIFVSFNPQESIAGEDWKFVAGMYFDLGDPDKKGDGIYRIFIANKPERYSAHPAWVNCNRQSVSWTVSGEGDQEFLVRAYPQLKSVVKDTCDRGESWWPF